MGGDKQRDYLTENLEQLRFIRARKAFEDRASWREVELSIDDDGVLSFLLPDGVTHRYRCVMLGEVRELLRLVAEAEARVKLAEDWAVLILPLGPEDEVSGLDSVTVLEVDGGGLATVVRQGGRGQRYALFGIERL